MDKREQWKVEKNGEGVWNEELKKFFFDLPFPSSLFLSFFFTFFAVLHAALGLTLGNLRVKNVS